MIIKNQCKYADKFYLLVLNICPQNSGIVDNLIKL
jgi:hypothetical protein